MTTRTPAPPGRKAPPAGAPLRLRALVGSGDRIGRFVLPFLVVGVGLNVAFPAAFHVGGPPAWLLVLSVVLLSVGVTGWAWSALLVLSRVRAGELVTTGPYALVRHPLYTSVALLVLPWLGFLLDTWLGAALGAALYTGSRLFAPAEEADLHARFGPAWEAYRGHIKIPWV